MSKNMIVTCQDSCGGLHDSARVFGVTIFALPSRLAVRPLPPGFAASADDEEKCLAHAAEAFRFFQKVSRLKRKPWPTSPKAAVLHDHLTVPAIVTTVFTIVGMVLACGAGLLHQPTKRNAKNKQTGIVRPALDSEWLAEVRLRLVAGEPLCNIEADLDWRDNINQARLGWYEACIDRVGPQQGE
jgi:hypothetical protein